MHHGGAGTTAAGLRAAVPTSTAFAKFLIFVIVHWLIEASAFALLCSVQQPLSLSLGTSHSGESGCMPGE